VHVALPPGTAATRQHVGDDRTIDSDIAADGVTPPVTLTVGRSAEGTLEGVSSDLTVDAGLVSDPGAVDEPGDAVSPGQGADDSNTGGSDSDRGSGPADHRPAGGTSGATGTSGVLAFTGAEVLPLLLGRGRPATTLRRPPLTGGPAQLRDGRLMAAHPRASRPSSQGCSMSRRRGAVIVLQ
jgi:hypothetical protein